MSSGEPLKMLSNSSSLVRLSEIEFSACMKGYYNGINGGAKVAPYRRDYCIQDHEARLQECYQQCIKARKHLEDDLEKYCKFYCTPSKRQI